MADDGQSRSDAAPDPAVGREAEQSLLRGWLMKVPNGLRAMVLSGEPGIGKSTLLQTALDEWRHSGGTVLTARPAMDEVSLELSGIVDLFEPLEVDVVVARNETDPIARGRMAVEALQRCAGDAPTLIAIDDVQWLDAASVRSLRYALRRLHSAPLGVMVTTRGEADALDLPGLLPVGDSEAVTVGALDPSSIGTIVRRVQTTISPPLLRRIQEMSAGNPLFALELARDLRWADEGLLPESLQDAIRHRLSDAPPDLMPLLDAVAVLARTSISELDVLLRTPNVVELINRASELDLLSAGDNGEVRFAHPLIGTVVYEQVPTLAKRSLHARAARHTSDADRAAHHLARCTDPPDPVVAGLLEDASRRAADRGEHGLAAEFGAQSVRLTEPDDERSRVRRACEQTRFLAAAGEMTRALEVADRLIDSLPAGPVRAGALVERAQLEDADLDVGEQLLVRALEESADDAVVRGRVLDQLGWLRGVFRGDLSAGVACARDAWSLADAVDDHDFRMSAAAGLSNMQTLAGSPRPDLMDEAVAIEQEFGRPPLWAGPSVLRAEQLLWAGDLGAARSLLRTAVTHAEQRGNHRWQPYSLYDLAAVEGAAGNFFLADELLGRAFEAARDCEDAHVESWIFYRHALVATWLGRVVEARRAAQHRVDTASRRGERPGLTRARSVLGLLALSLGDLSTAVRELTASVRLLDEMGFAHPGAVPALPDAIEALALAGDVDSAGELLAKLGEQAARVDSAWVDAALERATGTVALAHRDEAAPSILDRAAVAFADLGFRPDSARATLVRGRALVRAGKRTEAADALTSARDAFASMGAQLWADRAAGELERAMVGRTSDRASSELTATERRIAELVTDGLKNREIAQRLFVKTATVEAHLTRIYRKLQIRSRSELALRILDADS